MKKHLLEWDDKYSYGIDEIDDQHKEILNLMKELYGACKKRKIKEFILPLIEQLDFYVTIHFATEEKYAKEYNFDKLNELIAEHEFFKNLYYKIKNYYIKETSLEKTNAIQCKYIHMFALHLNKTLIEWLDFHMNTIDKDLGDFLKDKVPH